MQHSWILVADSSRARIFAAGKATSPLAEVKDLTHPEARFHEQKLTSDLPGSQAGGAGGSHHGVSGETDSKTTEAVNFAREITDYLNDAWNRQEFQHLIVIAAPSFLGLLRDKLTGEISKAITLSLDKNLVKHGADEIREHLPRALPG